MTNSTTTYKIVIKEASPGKWKIEVEEPQGTHPRIDVGPGDTIHWRVEGVQDPGNNEAVVVFQFPLGNRKYFSRRIIRNSKIINEFDDGDIGHFISLKFDEELEFTVKDHGVVPAGLKEFSYSVLVKEDCYLAEGGSSPSIFVIIKDE